MIKIFCHRLSATSTIPIRMHGGDAGFDLYADDSKTIPPNDVELIGTGLSFMLPDDYCALILSRSGLAVKNKVFVLNSPGLIDSGYRGEIKVAMFNAGSDPYGVVTGDRIAQVMFLPLPNVVVAETFELLTDTDRGVGGFGSTGIGFDEEGEFSAPI